MEAKNINQRMYCSATVGDLVHYHMRVGNDEGTCKTILLNQLSLSFTVMHLLDSTPEPSRSTQATLGAC